MKLVLSLDGGGIRERFVVEILAHIENATGKKIRDLFDMVVGVSAGAASAAVIASGAGVRGAIVNPFEVFRTNSSNGFFSTKYTGVGKTNELRRKFGSRKMASLDFPVAILTVKMRTGEAVVFTNSDSDNKEISIAEVVDASSAAPVYFPAVRVNGEYYIDGGVANNDPVFVGLEYARRLWPDEQVSVLSLGTGTFANIEVNGHEMKDFGLVRWLSEGLLDIMTDSRRNYNEPVIDMVVGKGNYLRITSDSIAITDDVSKVKEEELVREAGQVWMKNGTEILEWIRYH